MRILIKMCVSEKKGRAKAKPMAVEPAMLAYKHYYRNIKMASACARRRANCFPG
jgi:hypothetical protein